MVVYSAGYETKESDEAAKDAADSYLDVHQSLILL